MNKWIRTDDTQAVKYIDKRMYNVIDIMSAGEDENGDKLYGISFQTVDLDNYTNDDIIKYLDTYGYDGVDNVKEIYGELSDQIIAECIAETDWRLNSGKLFKSENDAIDYVEKEIVREKIFQL